MVPAGYMGQMLYAIFQVKLSLHDWVGDVNFIRAWLLIECACFFSWITCGVLFLFAAYIFKFRSVAKTDAVMEQDENVWNDSSTDDFLRYLKFEFFLLCYLSTFLIMDVFCGFSTGPTYDLFG